MDTSGGQDLFARLIDRVFQSSRLFHYARVPTYFGSMRRIRAAVDTRDGERLLDVGCGTGLCAAATRGFYVGVDPCRPYLQFGRRRHPRANCFFVAMSAFALGFADGSFDKALVVNMVHHLDDAAVGQLLVQLRRVVSNRVVLLDAAPEDGNALERFLLRHDRGAHIRRRADLRALLSRHYKITGEQVFHNAIHTVPQVLFEMAPGPNGA